MPCQTCSLPGQRASLGHAAWPVGAPWGHQSPPAPAFSPSLGLGAAWGAQKPQAPWGSGAACPPAEPLCGPQWQGDSPAPEGRARVPGAGTCGGSAPAGSSSCTALGTPWAPSTGRGTSQHGAASARLMQPLSPPQDLGSKDLKRERLFLVCQIIRVGRMDLRETYSRKLSTGLRRPFGISGESRVCRGCREEIPHCCPRQHPPAPTSWPPDSMGLTGRGVQWFGAAMPQGCSCLRPGSPHPHTWTQTLACLCMATLALSPRARCPVSPSPA